MKHIGENEELLKFLSGEYCLISSVLYKVNLYSENGELIVECFFKLGNKNIDSLIKLKLEGVKEYSFYYNSDYFFYNIESLKFFKANHLMYLCLDPFGEIETISQKDQDFVLSDKVNGWIIG